MATFEPTIQLVHADSRGEMYSISLPGDRELMLLHSTKGSLRGGHSHDVPESVMVLTGQMRYHKTRGLGFANNWNDFGEGEYSTNDAGKIHMGEFLEDTWLIEWKIGSKKQESKTVDYEPYRVKVRASILSDS